MGFELFLCDNNEFSLWSAEHLVWLALAAASAVFWIWLGKSRSNEAEKTRIGLLQSLVPVAAWLYFLTVILATGQWDWQNVLPLHICYFLNFVMPFMLARRVFWLYEASYFWIMAGCAQALFTPDLRTAFPGYFSVKYWFVHIGLVQSCLYATLVYGFRPRWQGIFIALFAGNIYMAFAHGINLALGTNFMYTVRRPPGTMLDLFGERYLLAGQGLALVLFAIVWLPFAFSSKRRKSTAEAS